MAQRGGDAHMQCGAQARFDKSILEFSILAGCLLSPYDCTSVLARCAACCSRTVNMKRASCRCCYCVELGAILENIVVCSHSRARDRSNYESVEPRRPVCRDGRSREIVWVVRVATLAYGCTGGMLYAIYEVHT